MQLGASYISTIANEEDASAVRLSKSTTHCSVECVKAGCKRFDFAQTCQSPPYMCSSTIGLELRRLLHSIIRCVRPSRLVPFTPR